MKILGGILITIAVLLAISIPVMLTDGEALVPIVLFGGLFALCGIGR